MKSQEIVVPQLIRRLSFQEWGGTETVVWNSCKSLKTHNVHSEILATQALCDTEFEKIEGQSVRRFPYYYPYFGLKKENILSLDKKGGNPYSPALENYLMHMPQLDLIHCHAMQRMAGLAKKVAQKRNVPFIVSFHGGQFEVPQSEIDDMVKAVKSSFHYGRFLDPILGYSKALDAAHGLICVGHSEYEKTRKVYPHKDVCYIPNGVYPEVFKQGDRQAFRQRHGIPLDMPLLLTVGRIDPQKNQLALLNILKALPANTGLCLIGPEPNPEYAEQIRQQIQAEGLTERVWMIQGLKAESQELIDAYHGADCFVLPSRHEPFGIVILEAWASGLPIVAANVGGIQALVKHEKTGYKCQSETDFIQAIQQVLSQPQTGLIENALHEVETQYSWTQISQRLKDFYLSLIQSHRKN